MGAIQAAFCNVPYYCALFAVPTAKEEAAYLLGTSTKLKLERAELPEDLSPLLWQMWETRSPPNYR